MATDERSHDMFLCFSDNHMFRLPEASGSPERDRHRHLTARGRGPPLNRPHAKEAEVFIRHTPSKRENSLYTQAVCLK